MKEISLENFLKIFVIQDIKNPYISQKRKTKTKNLDFLFRIFNKEE